jgi:uncharacterized protein YjcR
MEIVEGSRREVMYQLRLKGWTLKEIANEFGISSERVRSMCATHKKLEPLRLEYRAQRDLQIAEEKAYEQKELKFLSNYIEEIKGLRV